MTYSQQIEKAANHAELHIVGVKLYNAKNMPEEKRNALIKLYRERRRVLDRAMVETTTNSALKRALYAINTMAKHGTVEVAKTGKSIYDLTKAGILDKFESDLCFRAYRRQKAKAGITFGHEGQATA